MGAGLPGTDQVHSQVYSFCSASAQLLLSPLLLLSPRDAHDKFSSVCSARLRLVQQLGHLAGALGITVAGSEGANGVYNKLTSGFGGCVDTAKVGVWAGGTSSGLVWSGLVWSDLVWSDLV